MIARAHGSTTQRGMLILGFGTLVITLQDPIIKATMGAYPLAEAFGIRAAVAMPIFIVLLRRAGGIRSAFGGNVRQAILRACLFLGGYTAYFLAFPAMPLADVVALYFTAPLFIVALSRPLLGERQSASRWVAVLLGFAGALIIARPGAGGLGWAALLPILAAIAYSLGQLIARRYGETMSATALSFHQNWVYLVAAMLFAFVAAPFANASDGNASLEFLLRPWIVPDPRDAILLALCGPIAVGGTILLTKAYREAPPGAVTPLEYMALIWDTLWGMVLFAEVPDAATILGAAVIIASGVFAVTRGGMARTA